MITIAVEGTTDEFVVRKLLAFVGFSVHVVHGLKGKGQLDVNLAAYNNAARFTPWLIVRDLDFDAACASALVERLLPEPAMWMRYRIAVRCVEAWLLADRDAIAGFLRINRSWVPGDPDGLANPKEELVNLARRSRVRAIRMDMVPAAGTSSRVGPAYASRLAQFAAEAWRPDVASRSSDSLERCLDRVRELSRYASGDDPRRP